MVNWYCGYCGCEFNAPGMDESAECPECGKVLKNDPETFYNMMKDCGFDDEYIRNQ